MNNYRRIFKSKNTGKSILKELLVNLFIAELIDPSPKVWFVSPWISDLTIIDNSSGSFNSLNPDWNGKKVLLTDAVIQMLSASTKVYIISNNDPHNKIFIDKIHIRAKEEGYSEFLNTKIREDLHTKGIITNHGSLSGSMNLTYNGLEINEETILYFISRDHIQQDLIQCERYINE